jgi:dTDP-L-rhamnose 4-epimerase
MSEKVLVIGGAGFIGSHTVDVLIEEGFNVTILDNLSERVHRGKLPDYLNSKAQLVVGDVTNREDLALCLKDVSYVYNFAAYQDYMTDFSSFFSTNAVGTALLYELIVNERVPIKKVIIASSQFVQGEGVYKNKTGKLFYPEPRSKTNLDNGIWDHYEKNGEILDWQWTNESYSKPTNSYSISKHSQELIGINLGRQYEIPTVMLRYSIVQGSRQSFYNTYSGACRIFCLHFEKDIPPVIYEDGMMCRDFVNIHDAVKANLLVLKRDEANWEIFNIGGGKSYTILDFVSEVAKCFGKTSIVPNLSGKYRLGDTRNACSDISKIRALNWEPKNSITESILDYVDYMKSSKIPNGLIEESIKSMTNSGVIRKAKV